MLATDVFYSTLNFPYRLNLFSSERYFLSIELLIFISTSFFLFYKISSNFKHALIQSIAAFSFVFSVLGCDFVSWRTCFFPLLLLSFHGPAWGLPIITALWCFTASSLGFFGFLLTLIFTKRKIEPLVLLSLAIALFWDFPVTQLPDYPGDALLQPLTANTGGKTLFAYEHFFKFINQGALVDNTKRTVFIFILSLVAWLISFRPKGLLTNRLVPFAIVLAVLVYLGELSKLDYMPYRFFYRVIPGLATLPFVWDLSLIFIILILMLSMQYSKINNSLLSLAIFLLIVFPATYLKFPMLEPEILAENGSFLEQVKKSPSAFVLDYWGDGILETKNKSYTKLIPGKDYNYLATANVGSEFISKVFDDNLLTRWTSGQTQSGNETINVKFSRELEISRINLNGGDHYADFPRGLRVEVEDARGLRQVIFDKTNWLGPVRFSPRGFPYFGPQGIVEVTLPKPVKVVTLFLSQLGNDTKYNWSITELELFSENLKTENSGNN